MIEKLFNEVIDTINGYEYIIKIEKKKIKEISKTIRQLEKVNEKIENKVNVAPYIQEREEYLKSFTEHKQIINKLNRIYKILNNINE